MVKIIVTCLILAFSLACDDNGDNGPTPCPGQDFSDRECISEFLIASGERGMGCVRCTSDLRDEEFSLGFDPLLTPSGIGSAFVYPDGTFIPEFVGCQKIDLFEILENEEGHAIPGELLGVIADIEALPFELFLTVILQDTEPENILCTSCFVGPIPQECL